MPESKGRRRGQHKPTRARRRSGATPLGVSRVSTRPGEPGRRRIRPRTWRKIRRWGFITTAAVIAVVVIGSFALQGFPAGVGGGGGGTVAETAEQGAQIGDHLHASVRVEICGEDIRLPASPGGVHSHGDGRIHIHPQSAADAGPNANLGRFFDSIPMIVEFDRIQAPGAELYENGQACPDGNPGTVQVLVNGQDITDTFRDYTPQERNLVEVYFAVAEAGTPVAIEGKIHVDVGQTVEYRTTPPTSGNHWSAPGVAPADCGIYDEEVADERIVHNMEHGHVIISYNLPDSEDKRRLLELADDLRNLNAWGIVRPYSKIDQGTVAMTAWGVIDQVEGVDENRIKEFYDTYIHNRLSGEAARVRSVPCTS